MKVTMFPDYRPSNPYQALLAEALAAEDVTVEIPPHYRRGLHFSRHLCGSSAAVVHLHWMDKFLRGRHRITRRFYERKLRLDLRLALRGRGLVWTVHNLSRHDRAEDRRELSFNRWLAARADRIFVHDGSLVPQVCERYGAEEGKLRVIPHGHYADHYGPLPPRQEAREQLGLPQGDRVFLFLGLLRPYKGLEELLSVWPELHARHPDTTLVIAGGGWDGDFIAQIVSRGASLPGVRVHPGFVPEAEIPLHYAAADVAVFPFRAITTSGSVILALGYGCPVVMPAVESVAGSLDFLGARLYPPGSTEGLARALEAALEPPADDWPQAFATLREHFSWARAARLTAEGYREAARRAGGSA